MRDTKAPSDGSFNPLASAEEGYSQGDAESTLGVLNERGRLAAPPQLLHGLGLAPYGVSITSKRSTSIV